MAADLSHAETVADLVIHCKSLGIPFARDKRFAAALEKVVLAEGFDLEVMKNKISANKALMQEAPNMQGYIMLLEKVYNRGSRTRTPLAFNADEARRMRTLAQSVPPKYSGSSKAR